MSKLSEKDKLIALAYLHQGKSPKDVEEACPNISYAQALRLKKELSIAVEENTLMELFDLEEAAIESLLENVRDELSGAAEVLTGELEPLDTELANLTQNIKATQILEKELADTAIAIVRKLKLASNATSNIESLVMASDALSKLQTAFFKNSSIQIANFSQGNSFEKYLKP